MTSRKNVSIDWTVKEILVKAFDRLSRSPFPSLVHQYSKRDILSSDLDRSVGSALGIEPKELDLLLNDAYVTVTDELSQMAAMDKQDSKSKHRQPSRREGAPHSAETSDHAAP